MGWAFIILLSVAILAALYRFAHFRGAMLQLTGAALLAAMAGYAWQGHPGLGGKPGATEKRGERPETPFAALRTEFFERFDRSAQWLIIANSYQRRGDSANAVGIIRSGLRANPESVALWTGLGDALVDHGGGTLNPAAELAYRRAAALSPDHPAPIFFYGFSLIQSGKVAEGEKVWRDLLAKAPKDASWRGAVAERLAILDRLSAAN